MARSRQISRRMMLHGLGACVALPWLEIMSPSSVLGASGRAPVRLAYFYVPNGVHMPAWRPEEAEQLGQLPPTLAPLQSLSDRVTVISNLVADHCNGEGAAHEPAGGGFLVGARCKHSEQPEVGGKSVDQTVAHEIGLSTPIDSLALGIDPGHRGDHGYSGTYMSHISWRSPTTPVPLELNPRQLYDRLFRGKRVVAPQWNQAASDGVAATSENTAESVEASVLDLVQEETRSLQRQLGFSDRRKLEEYLEGLHSIERRIAHSNRDRHSHHQGAFDQDPLLHADEKEIPPLIIPEGKGIPSVYAEHVNLMLDILTMAFQSDTTRVASFMFSYEKSGRAYREIEAPGAHHSTSHHLDKPENFDQLAKINLHHMSLFARMLQRMKSIQEGEATLLDNVCILYGSGISDGNKHNHDDLPILLAGGAGGAVQGGRHLRLEKPTPICNLYLDMLAAMGVKQEHFGDSTGPLGLIQSQV